MTDKPDVNREELTDTVIEMIVAAKNIPKSGITLDSTFESLGVDSLDAMEILFEVEEKMDLNIPDTAARSMRNVKDVVDGLERLLRARRSSSPTRRRRQSPPRRRAPTRSLTPRLT